MLAGLTIITALLSLGFAFPAADGRPALVVWDLGFVASTGCFLVVFVRLLLDGARRRIVDDPTAWW
jgi:hypothetical protein